MKWTGLNDLRESFLKFFEEKGHLRLQSAPLLPKDDNSILLINAGMTPLKKFFQGTEEPPSKRAASCQKCIRTPDIENVGYTSRHGTYFEMLGNFSFGDYFKEEAISWAWEYFTMVLGIPRELLWITVYREDNEAADIWANKIGVPRERIVRLGKKDNFWEHGSGPCGPCSEIHFDRGEKYGYNARIEDENDRYVEIWNLVFTQFDSDGNGNYTPLASKNIDTGMGLERLACVMQGVDNLFEVDTIQNIMKKICDIVGKSYKVEPSDDVSIRIITDHIRSTVFMTADGVLPSNEGRGYVLRRLLRRAARHGRLLGYQKPFLYKICDTVIDENLTAYPELNEKREYIKSTIKIEEESFAKTIEGGLKILSEIIAKLPKNGVLNGDDAFKLHDTYGFPLDLTKEILAEKNFTLDEKRFRELMKNQRDTARANQSFKGGWSDNQAIINSLSGITSTFVGYYELSIDTRIISIIKNGEISVSCSEGDEVSIVLEQTPFYAESGGQAGDSGEITRYDNRVKVLDTKKVSPGLIICNCLVDKGDFHIEDLVTASVDKCKRFATMRNHTAAHLLQSALRRVLGEHVRQAGSLVDEHRCRFDFTHNGAMSTDEIVKVEELVNGAILDGINIRIEEMSISEARKIGAMALFGEKYGDMVRVIKAGHFSSELCGGTHVSNTSEIGLFKITSEASAAAGIRRIEAATGLGILELLKDTQKIISEAAAVLKLTNPANLVQKCQSVMGEMSALQKEKERLSRTISETRASEVETIGEVSETKLLTLKLAGANAEALRQAGDKLKSENTDFVAVIAGESNIYCLCDKGAFDKGFHSGNIIREIAAITGGKGGGRSESAMAGIGDVSKVDKALSYLKAAAEKCVSK